MAALISSVMNTKDRVPFYVNACHEMGIEVLPPDVNTSQVDFAVVEGKIRFGLNAVKNVGGPAAARDRAGARGGRPVHVDLGLHRARRPAGREQARARVARQGGRARLDRRDAAGDARSCSSRRSTSAGGTRPTGSPARARSSTSAPVEEERPRHHPPIPADEFEKSELLRLEKEALGLYVSEHPLSAIRDQLRKKCDTSLLELERRRDGEIVTVGGIVSQLKQLTTKKGDPMVFLRLDDVVGGTEVVVFNSVYAAVARTCSSPTACSS